jgi:hypothetical protein
MEQAACVLQAAADVARLVEQPWAAKVSQHDTLMSDVCSQALNHAHHLQRLAAMYANAARYAPA